MLTQAYLKSILSYDPLTGGFVWRVQKGSRAEPGQFAGRPNQLGYMQIQIDGKRYCSHRLAWLYVYGEFPPNDIDHIDGNPANNALLNLRLATRSQNLQNLKKARSNNKNGFLGVSWHKSTSNYQAEIRVNGKKIYLGLFLTPEAAHEAYLSAKRRLHEFNTL